MGSQKVGHYWATEMNWTELNTVNGFGIVDKAEVDVFLELSCFFHDPRNVSNLISGSSAFVKTSMNIWNFTVHILLNPGLENFEHYFTSVWDERQSQSEVAQLCLTLCDPMDCSLPGCSLHGILQARVLEWGSISFSRRSSQPRDRTWVSRIGGRCFNLWATREAHMRL